MLSLHNTAAAVAVFGSFLVSATEAVAEPIYLTCTFHIEGQPSIIDFTADESTGNVGIVNRGSGDYVGSGRNVPGAFTPDKLVIDEPNASWEISRVDLTIKTLTKAVGQIDYGKCEIKAAPSRKF